VDEDEEWSNWPAERRGGGPALDGGDVRETGRGRLPATRARWPMRARVQQPALRPRGQLAACMRQGRLGSPLASARGRSGPQLGRDSPLGAAHRVLSGWRVHGFERVHSDPSPYE
jgi:hypothetical protein